MYFFYGDEEYLIDKELQKFRDKLDKDFGEMNYVVYDELTKNDLISVLRTRPMMFGKMMIVINCFGLFKEGNKKVDMLSASWEDSELDEISFALDNTGEMLDIFFVDRYPRDDKKKKPDTRRKIFKILSKYNKQEFSTIAGYKTADLINQINKIAKEKSLTVKNDAALALIEYKGNNLRDYDTELEKLSLFAHPKNVVTKEMVNEMCSSNQDLFNLTDYIMLGESGKALIELRKLLETKHPMEILAPVQTMVKRCIFMKLNSSNLSKSEIGAKIGIHEYVVQKTLEKMKNVKTKYLVDMRRKLTEAEYKIKTGQSLNPEEELENAIIK